MIYTAIDSFYLSDELLQDSPSRKDGVSEETETNLRTYGCELMQEAGILLRLPQAVMATAQVVFHRFYCKRSFVKFNVKRVAASCLWLAAKLEESPRKIRDVLNVFHRVNRRRENLSLEPLEQFSKAYDELKTDLIRTERHLLKEMGFICHVEHPHKFIFNYLSQLEIVEQAVKQEAWNLANDSLRTTLCVRFKSEVVACGVIYAAARRAHISLPSSPPWWLAFDATKEEIDEVCKALAELYARPKASYVEVGVEGKSFVLSSRAWEPSPDIQDVLKPAPTDGEGKVEGANNRAEGSEAEESKEKLPPGKSVEGMIPPGKVNLLDVNGSMAKKNPDLEENLASRSGPSQGAKEPIATKRVSPLPLKERQEKKIEDATDLQEGSRKIKDQQMKGASRSKEKSASIQSARETDRDKFGLKAKDRGGYERRKARESEYLDRDRGRGVSGQSEMKGHQSSSKDRGRENGHVAHREKDRSQRHNPYGKSSKGSY